MPLLWQGFSLALSFKSPHKIQTPGLQTVQMWYLWISVSSIHILLTLNWTNWLRWWYFWIPFKGCYVPINWNTSFCGWLFNGLLHPPGKCCSSTLNCAITTSLEILHTSLFTYSTLWQHKVWNIAWLNLIWQIDYPSLGFSVSMWITR
jgi:hypothetical protein